MSLEALGSNSVEIFYSYAIEDERLRNRLEKHLSILKQQEFISNWHNRKISAGKEWSREVNAHLNTASLILLLVSPDFLASDYCYSIEMVQAMERHNAKEARVIPIILRPVDWEKAPFSKLRVLPQEGKPVTLWRNLDLAFLDVARGIRTIIEEINTERPLTAQKEYQIIPSETEIRSGPNRSNIIKELVLLLKEMRRQLMSLKNLPSNADSNDLYARTDAAIQTPVSFDVEKAMNSMVIIEEIYEILIELNSFKEASLINQDLYADVSDEVIQAASELKKSMNIKETALDTTGKRTVAAMSAVVGTFILPGIGTVAAPLIGGLMAGVFSRYSVSTKGKEEMIHLSRARDHIIKALEYLQ